MNHFRLLAAGLAVCIAGSAHAQGDSILALSLGEAARLAAKQGGAAVAATRGPARATAGDVRALRAGAQGTARAADASRAAGPLPSAPRQRALGVGVALDVRRARAQLASTRV